MPPRTLLLRAVNNPAMIGLPRAQRAPRRRHRRGPSGPAGARAKRGVRRGARDLPGQCSQLG
eukprot:8563943-Pyramimonas_sp.AAC.1